MRGALFGKLTEDAKSNMAATGMATPQHVSKVKTDVADGMRRKGASLLGVKPETYQRFLG